MAEMQKVFTGVFPAQPDMLSGLRARLREIAADCGCSNEKIDCLVPAVDEACSNIIRHGYGLKNRGEIIIEIFHNKKEIRIRIQDSAPHVDLSHIKKRDPAEVRPGGLGLYFIHKLMDRVEFPDPPERKGNIIELVKNIGNQS